MLPLSSSKLWPKQAVLFPEGMAKAWKNPECTHTHKYQGEETSLTFKELTCDLQSCLVFMVNRVGLPREMWTFTEGDVRVCASAEVVAYLEVPRELPKMTQTFKTAPLDMSSHQWKNIRYIYICT